MLHPYVSKTRRFPTASAVVAALQVGRGLRHGVVVSMLPDGGFKYTSAPFWTE